MEKTTQQKESFYKRFIGSKFFYPITLSLIATLCVSIWAINKSNRLLNSAGSYTSGSITAGDFFDSPTTAVQNTTATTLPSTGTTQKTTLAYEKNQAYTGTWSLPLKGEIGKDYSAGKLVKSTTMEDYRVHNGIDILAKTGTPVKAVNAGKILEVYQDAFWGTVIVADHGGGVLAKYCGLGKEPKVAAGDLVESGTVLGTLAVIPCEQKDESHLHLEMTVSGEVQDPIAVMNLSNANE